MDLVKDLHAEIQSLRTDQQRNQQLLNSILPSGLGQPRIPSEMAIEPPVPGTSINTADLKQMTKTGGTVRITNSYKVVQNPHSQSEDDVMLEPKHVQLEADNAIVDEAPTLHSTGAHHLMTWKRIKNFYQRAGVTRVDYVYVAESQQGVMRLFGRGSGLSQDFEVNPALSMSSPVRNAQSGIPSPATTASEDWARSYDAQCNRPFSLGGLNVNGEPRLDEPLVKRLYDSYMKHMWIIFPILDPTTLKQQIERFIASYCPAEGQPQSSSPYTPTNMTKPPESFPTTVPSKRKYSSESGPANFSAKIPPDPGYSMPIKGYIHRSMPNAIVLLVLALGKLCETNDFLHPPADEYSRRGEPAQAAFHGSPSTPGMAKSSPTPSATAYHSPGTYDPVRPGEVSRGSSTEFAMPESRYSDASYNVDRYPGLAYFAAASSIMGELYGGHTLTDAYAYILAGLYWGQIGRVMQSASYIIHAAHIVSELRMHHEDEITVSSSSISKVVRNEKKPGHFANLLSIAFWSVLQLESDIRAELEQLPLSPLSSMADRNNKVVRLPDICSETPVLQLFYERLDVSEVGFHFLAQISLRRHLNRTHTALYGEKSASGKATYSAEDLWSSLQSWRHVLPLKLQWKDDDRLSSDILIARLRAKYYGAAYIINRPYIYAALHDDNIGLDYGSLSEAVKLEDLGTSSSASTAGNGLKACQRCIAAALRSTTALDGLAPGAGGMSKRPRISNLHGTVTA
jgi:hypothetical protein